MSQFNHFTDPAPSQQGLSCGAGAQQVGSCNGCCPGPAGPMGPMGPAGPAGPSGNTLAGIIPYSSGYPASVPCNPDDQPDYRIATILGFGYTSVMDLMHAEGFSYAAIGYVTPRDIIATTLSVQVLSIGEQLVEFPEVIHAELYTYNAATRTIDSLGVEIQIPLAPGILPGGAVLADTAVDLSLPIPVNTKVILGMYLTGPAPSCLMGALSAGMGYM